MTPVACAKVNFEAKVFVMGLGMVWDPCGLLCLVSFVCIWRCSLSTYTTDAPLYFLRIEGSRPSALLLALLCFLDLLAVHLVLLAFPLKCHVRERS